MKRSRQYMMILSFVAALAACGPSSEKLDGHTRVLRRGISGEPASLDPAFASDNFSTQVVQDLYEGLVSEKSNSEIAPAAASSWTIDASGTKYTFQLRENARWSNGKPVRAQDFVFAWRRVVDPKQGSPVSNDLRLVAGAIDIISGHAAPETLGITATSERQLVVQLERPAPYFLEILSHSSTFPIFSDASARSHISKDWVSNGAFVLSEWTPGTNVDLVRNNEYWDTSNVSLDRVEYQIMSDQYAQLAAYQAGQLDLTDTIPSNAIPTLRAENSQEVVIAPYSAVAYYGLNMSAPPLATKPQLRKALAMAIDRRRLVTAMAAGQIPAYGFIPPGIQNYNSESMVWKNLSDLDRVLQAQRLYREAGFSAKSPLRLRLLLNSNPSIKQTATLVAAMWKETLGVETALTEEEFRVFLNSRKDKKRWDVLRLAWNADFNDASNFLEVFRSNSPNNDTGYSSATFDSTLDLANQTTDAATREELLGKAERAMLDEAPVIPLYFFVSKHLVKPYLRGFQPNSVDRVQSQSLTIEAH